MATELIALRICPQVCRRLSRYEAALAALQFCNGRSESMTALREFLEAKEEATAGTHFVVDMFYDGPLDGFLGPFATEDEAQQAIKDVQFVITPKPGPTPLPPERQNRHA